MHKTCVQLANVFSGSLKIFLYKCEPYQPLKLVGKLNAHNRAIVMQLLLFVGVIYSSRLSGIACKIFFIVHDIVRNCTIT